MHAHSRQRPIGRWVGYFSGITTLSTGLVVAFQWPNSAASVALFLFAILSTYLLSQRTSPLWCAAVTTIATILSAFWHAGDPNTEVAVLSVGHGLSVGAYWICATFLYLDPRRGTVTIDAWQDIFQSAPAGMAMIDGSGRIVRCNTSFSTIIGLDDAQLVNTTIENTLGKDVWDYIRPHHPSKRVFDADASIQLEREYTDPSGEVHWIRVYVRILEDDAAYSNMTILQILDLTEKHNAQHALITSESIFRGII